MTTSKSSPSGTPAASPKTKHSKQPNPLARINTDFSSIFEELMPAALNNSLHLRPIRACYALMKTNKQLEYVNIQKGTKQWQDQ